jgi:hypothetical protein
MIHTFWSSLISDKTFETLRSRHFNGKTLSGDEFRQLRPPSCKNEDSHDNFNDPDDHHKGMWGRMAASCQRGVEVIFPHREVGEFVDTGEDGHDALGEFQNIGN